MEGEAIDQLCLGVGACQSSVWGPLWFSSVHAVMRDLRELRIRGRCLKS